VGPNNATGTAANHNFGNRWRRSTQFVLRNSIIIGWQKAGFSLESDNTIRSYMTDGTSEFRNNLVHAVAEPFKSGNANLATAAQLRTKAEAEGCIVYTDPAGVQLTSPFYSTNPNFLPATGSPALTGASFTGMNAFFTVGTFRGAMRATNWTTGWTNWDPQNKAY
jgi:hypothetical protein